MKWSMDVAASVGFGSGGVGSGGVRSGGNAPDPSYWRGFLEGVLAAEEIEGAAPVLGDFEAACFPFDRDPSSERCDIGIAERDGGSGEDEMSAFIGFCAGICCDGPVGEPAARAIAARMQGSALLAHSSALAGMRAVMGDTAEAGALRVTAFLATLAAEPVGATPAWAFEAC